MKWKATKEPEFGECRRVRRFIFFPKTLRLGGSEVEETRWLEFAWIKQSYQRYHSHENEWVVGWNDVCWVVDK